MEIGQIVNDTMSLVASNPGKAVFYSGLAAAGSALLIGGVMVFRDTVNHIKELIPNRALNTYALERMATTRMQEELQSGEYIPPHVVRMQMDDLIEAEAAYLRSLEHSCQEA
jgi:hypothetical protein